MSTCFFLLTQTLRRGIVGLLSTVLRPSMWPGRAEQRFRRAIREVDIHQYYETKYLPTISESMPQ